MMIIRIAKAKIIGILFIVPWFLLYSCGDGGDKKAADTTASNSDTTDADSSDVETIDTVLTSETISFFNQSGFSTFAKDKSPGFDWSKFRMTNTWHEDSLLITDFSPQRDFYTAYKSLLKYSPDSTKFLDLDSYNLSVQTNKGGKLTGAEIGPDTEISMVDVKTGKKTRLIFLGPGNSIEDGSWIDNENLVIMGFQQQGNSDSTTPTVWRYHLPTQTFYTYEMPDPEVARKLMGEWRKQRLKNVSILNSGN
jgi:hypothetical protein